MLILRLVLEVAEAIWARFEEVGEEVLDVLGVAGGGREGEDWRNWKGEGEVALE